MGDNVLLIALEPNFGRKRGYQRIGRRSSVAGSDRAPEVNDERSGFQMLHKGRIGRRRAWTLRSEGPNEILFCGPRRHRNRESDLGFLTGHLLNAISDTTLALNHSMRLTVLREGESVATLGGLATTVGMT